MRTGHWRRLARELADVGVRSTVERLQVDGLTRTFDVWFDNIFTDWSVKSRISGGLGAHRSGRAARARPARPARRARAGAGQGWSSGSRASGSDR